SLPISALPAKSPLACAFERICRVRKNLNRILRNGQRAQCLNDGNQLHAVVGGLASSSTKLPHFILHSHDGSPASRTRVARASAVGVNKGVIHGLIKRQICGTVMPRLDSSEKSHDL